MGKHDKRGLHSRKRYQRVQYGGIYQVKSEDAVTPQQFQAGQPHGGFVRLEQVVAHSVPSSPPPAPTATSEQREAVRKPVQVQRQPMEQEIGDYIDTMASMTVSELKALLDKVDFGPDELASMIAAEKANKDRIGAVKILEKYLSALS
jgi:hypothetical protein